LSIRFTRIGIKLATSYVVDTTELVSFMLNPHGLAGRIIRSLVLDLYAPYVAIDEIWKHKDEWFKKRPNLSLADFTDTISSYIKVVPIDRNGPEYTTAYKQMKDIDPNDTEFIALALQINSPVWSEDEHFSRQTLVEVVTTQDIFNVSWQRPELWQALNRQ